VTYGSLPQVGWLFYGIKPIVIAIIAQVLVGLCRTVLKGVWPVVLAVLVLALYLLGINTITLLFGGALLFGIIRWVERWNKRRSKPGGEINSLMLPFSFASLRGLWQNISITKAGIGLVAVVAATVPYSLPLLFL